MTLGDCDAILEEPASEAEASDSAVGAGSSVEAPDLDAGEALGSEGKPGESLVAVDPRQATTTSSGETSSGKTQEGRAPLKCAPGTAHAFLTYLAPLHYNVMTLRDSPNRLRASQKGMALLLKATAQRREILLSAEAQRPTSGCDDELKN